MAASIGLGTIASRRCGFSQRCRGARAAAPKQRGGGGSIRVSTSPASGTRSTAPESAVDSACQESQPAPRPTARGLKVARSDRRVGRSTVAASGCPAEPSRRAKVRPGVAPPAETQILPRGASSAAPKIRMQGAGRPGAGVRQARVAISWSTMSAPRWPKVTAARSTAGSAMSRASTRVGGTASWSGAGGSATLAVTSLRWGTRSTQAPGAAQPAQEASARHA